MKEVIIAECDGDDYIHCCRYQQVFDYTEDNPSLFKDHKGGHFTITIFTTKQFPAGQKVKITIETVEK